MLNDRSRQLIIGTVTQLRIWNGKRNATSTGRRLERGANRGGCGDDSFHLRNVEQKKNTTQAALSLDALCDPDHRTPLNRTMGRAADPTM